MLTKQNKFNAVGQNDGNQYGLDLSPGWLTEGDNYVKAFFPNASTTSLVALTYLEAKYGANRRVLFINNIQNVAKYNLDLFVNAFTGDKMYAQCGKYSEEKGERTLS